MTTLRTLLISIGFVIGFVLLVGFDAFPLRWIWALAVAFLAIVGGVWAIAYATRNEVR